MTPQHTFVNPNHAKLDINISDQMNANDSYVVKHCAEPMYVTTHNDVHVRLFTKQPVPQIHPDGVS